MTSHSASLPQMPPDRKLSGATRTFLGFIVGALCALAPMYYLYTTRDTSAHRSSPAAEQELTATAQATAGERLPAHAAHDSGKPFASRMTYELSQLPEEPPVSVAAAAPPPTSALPQEVPPARVSNARPISAQPLEARDRTVAIEREAQRPDYREAQRAVRQAAAAEPRIFEGRDVVLDAPRLPATPTRPILARVEGNTRAEIEAERRLASETPDMGPAARPQSAQGGAETSQARASGAVAGVLPITGPLQLAKVDSQPKSKGGTERLSQKAQPDAGLEPADGIEARLAATRDWLAASPETTHTIQLMGTQSEAHLKAQLKSLSKVLEPANIHVFRTVAQGKPSITVVYGSYADKRAAIQALQKLPPAVASNRPVLRTVTGIRAEMKQHKTDS